MKSRVTTLMLMTCLCVTPFALAQDEAPQAAPPTVTCKDFVSIVPADAWGFVVVRNPAELEQKAMQMATRLTLPAMPMLSMIKSQATFLSTMNDTAPFGVCAMPVEELDDFDSGIIALVSSTDAESFAVDFEPEDVEGGIKMFEFHGEEKYFAVRGKYVAIGDSIEMLKRFLDSKASMGKALPKSRVKEMEKSDLFFWVNAENVIKHEGIAGMLSMFDMMSGQMGSENAPSEQVKQFKDLSLSLGLSDKGIGIQFYMSPQPDSDMAKAIKSVKNTTDSLLTGLPAERFVLAGGARSSAEAAGQGADQVVQMLDNPMFADIFDPDMKEAFTDGIKTIVSMLRGYSASFAALPKGPDGLIGMAIVAEVEDSAKWLEAVGKLVTDVQGGLLANEEMTEMTKLATHTKEAEKVAGVPVDTLLFDVDQGEEGEEDGWSENIKKVLGKDGILFRLAPADGKHVVVTFGGGSERLGKVIAIVKAKKSPLSEDSSIKKVAANLPKKRASEFYLAVDAGFGLFKAVQEARGEEDALPIDVPDINAPIGMASSINGLEAQVDVFIPMELVITVKDAVMQMMGMGMAGEAVEEEAPM